jgi:hypothetical protein
MTMQNRDNSPSGRSAKALAMSLGTQLAVGMLFFTWLGSYVDRKRGHGHGFTLAGIFVGLFYCGYEVWKLIRQLQEIEKEDEGQ